MTPSVRAAQTPLTAHNREAPVAAEQCCVVQQTLTSPPMVQTTFTQS